jgi:hypothetical protein
MVLLLSLDIVEDLELQDVVDYDDVLGLALGSHLGHLRVISSMSESSSSNNQ